MTAEEFDSLSRELHISRAALCRRLGIATNSGTAYALGRQPIPRVVALACAAITHDLSPIGTSDA